MMSEASFASLGPTLLARKGGAKPAMRPQLTPLPEDLTGLAALAEEQLEDLGWNDMGTDRDPDSGADSDAPLLSIKPTARIASRETNAARSPETQDRETDLNEQVIPITARTAPHVPANEDGDEGVRGNEAQAPANPFVRSQQERLERRYERETAGPVDTAPARSRQAKRAAFTLRLDTDRHLKLRLASTMQGVSAQSLVTEALDAMLDNIDGLETLVERMKRD